MNKKVTAIVPAAGLGKRFGQGSSKPFQTLGNKPLVVWVFEILESINEIAEILPVFKKDDMALGCGLLEKFKFSKVKRIAPGGKERQDSVYGALNLIDKETDVVLIHDGVRPLIKKSTVEESIRQLKGFDGVVAGVPLKDTIKEVACQVSGVRRKGEEIIVKKTLNRNVLWAIQTPQVFKYSALMTAYRKAMDERFYSTDDSAIVEKYGGRVKVIMGSYSNIKITTPEDIGIAEMLLSTVL
ncbi:MAG: 2-C-methyl-D-erythritol 4-phosphate cytidylyltransferase [Nitrospirae bacterium]|nr:2-C-methyl-D-erythritol 4-phosphate cytidylyltransferase [Nitrospirota bacterium]OIO31554.1 MAG: 2-C-methyl-D-erythritol 4-phosphate cytidylyltransferase [Nitrospirae bacterium CG1_02_44_142]PIP71331.1 MAG: 2-C-methyl-D-erythritol 4-phosphate cytidylyltransferase [Nitrospirae bacterium CG22_combo_CG10-13_8_21_14_all_44_11]PIV41017.1 MAG: 2-C-methyl-D-erythritol 4-phosphate cytidylyltransferase [Nitrospirae bacterium CG02_land_8_20_14_3_00_44_33]PIV67172.1 MAG: 2-C-methyl-D-erythritol 4-phosp